MSLNAKMERKDVEETAAKRAQQPRREECDGCGCGREDAGRIEEPCPGCGYQVCESCACHHSRGAWLPLLLYTPSSFSSSCPRPGCPAARADAPFPSPPPGTCDCEGSNFGKLYCRMFPGWYHGHRGRSYVGSVRLALLSSLSSSCRSAQVASD